MEQAVVSIDQNCTPFWDTWAKLDVWRHQQKSIVHLIHDTDTVFHDEELSLEDPSTLKWFYNRSDGFRNYSPNLFYYRYLGRHESFPVKLLERWQGMKLSGISAAMELPTDQLMDQWGVYDKLAVVGSGRVGNGFRIAAGVDTREIVQPMRELFDAVKLDMRQFIVTDQQMNNLNRLIDRWKSDFEEAVESDSTRTLSGSIVAWMRKRYGSAVEFSSTFEYFRVSPKNRDRFSFFIDYLADYGRYSTAYNAALQSCGSSITPIDTKSGGLPFYGVKRVNGQLCRYPFVYREGKLHFNDAEITLSSDPWLDVLDLSTKCQIESIVGKAIPLMMQIRNQSSGNAVTMPMMGSPYMRVVDQYADLLYRQDARKNNPNGINKVIMVDFDVYGAMEQADFLFRLPPFLQKEFGCEIIHARDFPRLARAKSAEAKRVLERCLIGADERTQVYIEKFPTLAGTMDELEEKRKKIGKELSGTSRGTEAYHQLMERFLSVKVEHKRKQKEFITEKSKFLFQQWHVSGIDYWNHRGSIELWATALGGEEFYQQIIEKSSLRRST
ncbi:hypothetical protein [Paenibacillus kobensis]|uniref:hypothetical protein n=1 Tax=Paenibacillus kobensis TaxID=59841 RepID=UPI000FDB9618|nr:hypothetical protein [Paenibacillus kobensis]